MEAAREEQIAPGRNRKKRLGCLLPFPFPPLTRLNSKHSAWRRRPALLSSFLERTLMKPVDLLCGSVTRFALLWSLVISTVGVATSQEASLRLWSDASGRFKVRASLQRQDATTVVLHTEDGRSIQVPIERLSQEDRDHLQSLRAPSDNPFAGGTPIGEVASTAPAAPGSLDALPPSQSIADSLALPGTGNELDLESAGSSADFVPDPMPKPPRLPGKSVAITAVDAYDKVSSPVLMDPQSKLFAVSVGRNKSGSPEETRGRLFVVSLDSGQSQLVWDKPSAVRVLGHDQRSGRTLIVDQLDQFERGGELVMLEGVVAGSPKVLFRRALPGLGKPGFQPMVEWARLLSASHVAAIVDGALMIWDLPAAQLLYRIDKVKASEPPAFSGNLKYMAVPQSGKVVVVETATGQVVKATSTGSTLVPGVAFHPGGSMLAICASNQYMVWDCQTDRIVSEAVTTDHLGSWPLDWIGNKTFRSSLGSLVDVELGMPVWKYNIGAASKPLVIGNQLLTTTRLPLATLCSLPIPHETAEEGMERLMRAGDEAMLVRRGSEVSIAVEGVSATDASKIEEALSAAATKAGWSVNRNAPIRLVAKIGRGETEELKYRGMLDASRKISVAKITPFTADLEIRDASNVLWKRSSTNHVPRMLRLQEGETVQDAVKRYEKPDPGFFARLNLPPRIPKPEVANQIGMSSMKDGQWMDISPSIRNRGRGRQR